MEGSELLEREAKFRQLNKELEKRTQTLLNNIETAMQKQDSFADITSITFGDNRTSKAHRCKQTNKTESDPQKTQINVPTPPKPVHKSKDSARVEGNKCCCLNTSDRSKDGAWEFLEAFISVNVQDNVLPKSFLKEGTSGESVCKFLVSKLKLMQEQTERLQAVIDKKAAQCERHLSAQADLESQRHQLTQRAESLRAQAERHAHRVQSLEKQLLAHNETERLYNECRREKERLSAEVKRARAAAVARSAPLEETVARLEAKLSAAVAADKDYREAARAHAASQQERVDSLERQKRALQTSVSKLSLLADNLRRQNATLDTGVRLRGLELQYGLLLQRGDIPCMARSEARCATRSFLENADR